MTYYFGTKTYGEIKGEIYLLLPSGRYKQSHQRSKMILKKGEKQSVSYSKVELSWFAHTPIFN